MEEKKAAPPPQTAVHEAPPPEKTGEEAKPPAQPDADKPKPKQQTKPKKSDPKEGVGMAIAGTVIIVLALAAMATYAYLKTR